MLGGEDESVCEVIVDKKLRWSGMFYESGEGKESHGCDKVSHKC